MWKYIVITLDDAIFGTDDEVAMQEELDNDAIVIRTEDQKLLPEDIDIPEL